MRFFFFMLSVYVVIGQGEAQYQPYYDDSLSTYPINHYQNYYPDVNGRTPNSANEKRWFYGIINHKVYLLQVLLLLLYTFIQVYLQQQLLLRQQQPQLALCRPLLPVIPVVEKKKLLKRKTKTLNHLL